MSKRLSRREMLEATVREARQGLTIDVMVGVSMLGAAALIGAAEAATSLSKRYGGVGSVTVADFLSQIGYTLVSDPDYYEVAMEIKRGRTSVVKADPIFRRRYALVVYVNNVRLNPDPNEAKQQNVSIRRYVLQSGDRVVIKREKFDSRKQQVGIQNEPAL